MKNFLICFFFIVSGCSVVPHYSPPPVEVPLNWHSDITLGMEKEPLVENGNWWESFCDETLNSLIEQASESNLDLLIAATRILEARLERKGKSFDYLPHIDGSFTAGHLYYNKKGILEKVIDCDSHKRNVNFFEIGFDASWELDFFGKTAHEINALQAKLEATEATYCDIWLTLTAEVARNYMELRLYQRQKCLLLEKIQLQKEILLLQEELVIAGIGSSIDVEKAIEQLYLLEAKLPQVDFLIAKTIHRLSVLIGSLPDTLFDELTIPKNLPCLPQSFPIGLPSDLLRRRPDIRRAERNLAAAYEYVGVAVASLFPSFSLTGFIGCIHSHLPSLISPESYAFFIAPQILAPIFNSKMIQQDVCYNRLKAKEACFEYKKTILNALEEAENAIAIFQFELESRDKLYLALESSEEAYLLIEDLFQRGLKSYLEVLPYRLSYMEALENFEKSEANLLSHFIALYKTLGGGF